MILNKFIDKTLKAAKQSALQIAGDDYAELKNNFPENAENNDRSLQDNGDKQQSRSSEDQQLPGKSQEGVIFERSDSATSGNEKIDSDFNKKLESIRKYAAQQTAGNGRSFDQKDSQQDAEPIKQHQNSRPEISRSDKKIYSRKDIQNNRNKTSTHLTAANISESFDNSEMKHNTSTSESNEDPLYDKLLEDLPNGVSRVSNQPAENKQEKYSNDLDKRLERLESLVQLALSTPENVFSTHPLFHKLQHKGVSQKMITRWFDTVAQQGIDPNEQPELVHSKLWQLIDKLLQQSKAEGPKKTLLFSGRSGSGKTHLIMKLALQPGFLTDKEIAVASFSPADGNPRNKYSILTSFCSDQDIDFYSLSSLKQVGQYHRKFKNYDHILIDTPGLETGGASLVECMNILRNKLKEQTSIETHYLINTAVSGAAYNDPLAKEIKADHIALTHIDQSLSWGKSVQLMANTDYKLRYISSGPTITGDLLPFIPKKFAKKLLRG